jgi:hypothetical protein
VAAAMPASLLGSRSIFFEASAVQRISELGRDLESRVEIGDGNAVSFGLASKKARGEIIAPSRTYFNSIGNKISTWRRPGHPN